MMATNEALQQRGLRSTVIIDESGNSIAASSYPSGATAVTASATGTTAATAATLPAAAGKTTYIAGFHCSGRATAALQVDVTVAGVVTATMNFQNAVTAGATTTGKLEVYFNPPIPASAVNTAIVVTQGAAGAGGVTAVSAWGYQL